MPAKNKIKIDWIIVICVFLLTLYGLMAIYSATYGSEPQAGTNFFLKQILWILIGFCFMFGILFIPPGWLQVSAYVLYGVNICLLIYLIILPHAGGPSRWIGFGGIQLQPSEFMKPVLVITLAAFLSSNQCSLRKVKDLLTAFIITLLPLALVLKQPDLGTSLTFLVLLIPMLYWKGLSLFVIFVLCAPIITFLSSFNFWTFFFIIILICGILLLSRQRAIVFWSVFLLNIIVGIVAPYFWNHLHTYQQQRILNFLGIISDPKGAGYQIIQSKVAIGSGGLIGKGFLHGTQTQLSFLPAQHTDFIFSVLAEEWGFLGAFVILVTFLILLIKGISIASSAKTGFSGLLTAGLVTIFAFQVVVNIGMTLGIMPVTGMPLPFISYGGSSMLSCMIMTGLILNTSSQRYK